MDAWWMPALREVFAGRRVILAGAVAAAWTEHVETLRSAGAADVMVIATEGRGGGALPDVHTVVIDPPGGLTFMQRHHHGSAVLEHPPDTVTAAIEAFDPDGNAVLLGSSLNTAESLADRPFLARRRPEWVALEDKVVVDAFWDRAGVSRLPAQVVRVGDAPGAAGALDRGDGTVWAADARDGFHGGASRTYWVVDDDSETRALAALASVCDRVRVMPFIEGVPCSIHGIVFPDGTAVLRPVEMVTLRRGTGFVYAGCATYWDPPDAVRNEMRGVARLAGARLAEELGFRGTFTVDGVVADDGFWPTELNPRFGAGINTIARASGVPMLLVNDLIVAGLDVGSGAVAVEEQLVDAADAHRGGGTWIGGHPNTPTNTARPVVIDGDGVRWAAPTDEPTATVTSGDGFIRCWYEPNGVPIGPSTAAVAARFWDFADRELGSDIGHLSPAPDVRP